MLIECYHCEKETNDWQFNDLEERLCPKCYQSEQESLKDWNDIDWDSPNILPEAKAAQKKREKGCYSWCADDCPQAINKCGDWAFCPSCQKQDYLECCDACKKGICLGCLGRIENNLFCEPCYRQKEGMSEQDEIVKSVEEVDLFKKNDSGQKVKTGGKMTIYSWEKVIKNHN